MQKKQWIVRTAPVELPAMAGEKVILPLTAAILAGRGISEPDAMDAFLSPSLADMLDPSRMKGMADAVARLLEARRRQGVYESALAGDAVIIHRIEDYGIARSVDTDTPAADFSGNEGSML